jgi:acetoin utilization deacetylase AcuC-like enzyme
MGFCLLNNVAVGVVTARELGTHRVAIIDFDVHHGNGTQDTFYSDPEVFYASTHQFPFYPGTGSKSERGEHGNVLNLPLVAGNGDPVFLSAYERVVGPALEAFRPNLLLVSAGFDAHERDPLAGLEVTTRGYRRLAELIKEWSERFCQGRSIWALEGGYDLEALSESVLACLEVLSVTDHRQR